MAAELQASNEKVKALEEALNQAAVIHSDIRMKALDLQKENQSLHTSKTILLVTTLVFSALTIGGILLW